MRGLMVVGVLMIAGAAWAQSVPGSLEDRAFRSGVIAGEALACEAPPEAVFRYWREAEAGLFAAPPLTEPGSMFFLAGLMSGLTTSLTPCRVAIARLLQGPAR